MCECGCFANGRVYRLPGPKGIVYIIRLLPACNYCSVGMTVCIERVSDDHDALHDMQPEDLPVSYECDGVPVTVISAGIEKDALVKVAEQCVFGEIDAITLGVVADEMWSLMPQSPTILTPDKEG